MERPVDLDVVYRAGARVPFKSDRSFQARNDAIRRLHSALIERVGQADGRRKQLRGGWLRIKAVPLVAEVLELDHFLNSRCPRAGIGNFLLKAVDALWRRRGRAVTPACFVKPQLFRNGAVKQGWHG